MPKIYWLLVGVLAPVAAYAQAGLSNYDLQDVTRQRPVSTQGLNQSNAEDASQLTTRTMQPDYYFTSAWLPGTITGPAGPAQPVAALRYNVVEHRVEVQDARVPGQVRAYPIGTLKGFTLGTGAGQVRFGAYRVRSSAEGRQQLQELTDAGTGPLHLLLRHELKVLPTTYNAALHMATQASEVQRSSSLYAARDAPGQPLPDASELPLSKRAVLRLFGESAPTLAAYAQQQKLDYTNADGVLKLVAYYNATVK